MAHNLEPHTYNQELPAIVAGGGGTFGIGWQCGIMDEFRERGADMRDAQMLGTSAGSWTASIIATDKSYDDIISKVSHVKAPYWRSGYIEEFGRDLFGDERAANVSAMAVRIPSHLAPQYYTEMWQHRGEENLYQLASHSLKKYIETCLPKTEKLNGGQHDLAKIVAASSSVPFLFAPTEVDGNYYVDGGARSMVSADLAPKSHTLLALSCMTRYLNAPAGHLIELHLHHELGKWQKQNNGKVVILQPNREISELVQNPMDCFSVEVGKRAYELARHQATDAIENRESVHDLLEMMHPINSLATNQ